MALSAAPLPVSRAGELAVQGEDERWLIRSLWGYGAVGIIGGAPKCGKSWLGLDMALSVASATPCLGHFPVEAPGPSLVFLAEDALPAVRARIAALCAHRGLAIEQLGLFVITEPALRLDLERDQQRLRATLASLRPRLLLLDPLVRLHRLDENSAADISRLLGFLRELQRTYELAVVLVHHASKRQRAQPGQGLRGSSDLHAFGDSNACLSPAARITSCSASSIAAHRPPRPCRSTWSRATTGRQLIWHCAPTPPGRPVPACASASSRSCATAPRR